MKKMILMAVVVFSGFVFQKATAQIRVSINANFGAQPVWGPAGYSRADYYYMPDIDVFYNVSRRQYIYEDRGRWIFSASLPPRYSNFDMYRGYKVVVNDPNPYQNARVYRTKYARYKGNHSQHVIRDSRDSRYYEIKEHPQHNRWKQDKDRRRKKQ